MIIANRFINCQNYQNDTESYHYQLLGNESEIEKLICDSLKG
jgi:hypothetical protein